MIPWAHHMRPGPVKGACAQPALGDAHWLNIPCHNSSSN